MSERKLATIRQIAELRPIPGADAIETAIIDGWTAVVKKGEFAKGELVVYCEIDSWIPHEIAPFLSKGNEPREYNGVKGERLRTMKLRGQLSQGLVLPITALGPNEEIFSINHNSIGADVTSQLGIQKWERELPAQLAGQVEGDFPWFLEKTDQERIQNVFTPYKEVGMLDQMFEATLKLDGSSCTIYNRDGKIGVCSRNLEMKLNVAENDGNTFVIIARKLKQALRDYGHNIALQGEVMGPGIQGNRESLKKHTFYLFDIWDIDNQEYLDPVSRYLAFNEIKELLGTDGEFIQHVPVIDPAIDGGKFDSVESFLEYAKRPSLNHAIAEGVVFKSITYPGVSFKAINNEFLLKGGD